MPFILGLIIYFLGIFLTSLIFLTTNSKFKWITHKNISDEQAVYIVLGAVFWPITICLIPIYLGIDLICHIFDKYIPEE